MPRAPIASTLQKHKYLAAPGKVLCNNSSTIMTSFLAPTNDPVTLVGCCHCKATKYAINLPELNKVSYCQCSICALQDFLWLSPKKNDVTFERTGPTSVYECGLKRLSFEVDAQYRGARTNEQRAYDIVVLLDMRLSYTCYSQGHWCTDL